MRNHGVTGRILRAEPEPAQSDHELSYNYAQLSIRFRHSPRTRPRTRPRTGFMTAPIPSGERPTLRTLAPALLLCVAVVRAAHGAQSAKLARRRLAAVTQDAGRLLQERARLAEEFSQERQ